VAGGGGGPDTPGVSAAARWRTDALIGVQDTRDGAPLSASPSRWDHTVVETGYSFARYSGGALQALDSTTPGSLSKRASTLCG